MPLKRCVTSGALMIAIICPSDNRPPSASGEKSDQFLAWASDRKRLMRLHVYARFRRQSRKGISTYP